MERPGPTKFSPRSDRFSFSSPLLSFRFLLPFVFRFVLRFVDFRFLAEPDFRLLVVPDFRFFDVPDFRFLVVPVFRLFVVFLRVVFRRFFVCLFFGDVAELKVEILNLAPFQCLNWKQNRLDSVSFLKTVP